MKALIFEGMGLVTSVLWLFYFIIGITWPSYVKAFTSFGAFMWYCVWCIIGLVLIYLCVPSPPTPLLGYLPMLNLFQNFVPETKGVELEDLDMIFNISTREFAREQRDWAIYFIKRYVFWRRKAASPSAQLPDQIELTPSQHKRHP